MRHLTHRGQSLHDAAVLTLDMLNSTNRVRDVDLYDDIRIILSRVYNNNRVSVDFIKQVMEGIIMPEQLIKGSEPKNPNRAVMLAVITLGEKATSIAVIAKEAKLRKETTKDILKFHKKVGKRFTMWLDFSQG